MGSSIRMHSWLLLAGLVSAALSQDYNGRYIPPARCLPASTKISEVTSYLTVTLRTSNPILFRTTKYETRIVLKLVPSTAYRQVINTLTSTLPIARTQILTDTQVQYVTRTITLPDQVRTSVVTVTTPSVVQRTVVRTKYEPKDIVRTRTETVTRVRTVTVTYPPPPAVYRTQLVTVRTTETRPVVVTEPTTIFNTVRVPAETITSYSVTTQTIEKTRVEVVPGVTSTVTKTDIVQRVRITTTTETVPYYTTSTDIRVKQELATVNKVVEVTVPSTSVGYTTRYEQQVRESIVRVPVPSTITKQEVVQTVIRRPGVTRSEVRDTIINITVPGPRVVKTDLRVRTDIQISSITTTVTSTDIRERLFTDTVKDCGGYNYQKPSVGLQYGR